MIACEFCSVGEAKLTVATRSGRKEICRECAQIFAPEEIAEAAQYSEQYKKEAEVETCLNSCNSGTWEHDRRRKVLTCTDCRISLAEEEHPALFQRWLTQLTEEERASIAHPLRD